MRATSSALSEAGTQPVFIDKHALIQPGLSIDWAQDGRPGSVLADSCFAKEAKRQIRTEVSFTGLFGAIAANANMSVSERVSASSCLVFVRGRNSTRRTNSELIVANTGDCHAALITVGQKGVSAILLTDNNLDARLFFSDRNKVGRHGNSLDRLQNIAGPSVQSFPMYRLPGRDYLLAVFTDGALPGVDTARVAHDKDILADKIAGIVKPWAQIKPWKIGAEFSRHCLEKIRASQRVEQDCISIVIADLSDQPENDLVYGVFDGDRKPHSAKFSRILAQAAYDKA